MKKNIITGLFAFTILLTSCLNGQNKNSTIKLTAEEFSNKINVSKNLSIIDVRTPDEFSKGHLINALNIDWNGSEFEKEIAPLDKSKPAFVYCLSGGRSSSAADKMRELGFKEVYELNGGMMKWRAINLPETKDNAIANNEISDADFEKLIASEQLVLIDFYADWCAPCQKMKPYLEEISKEKQNKVKVLRINVDDNKQLCKTLKIDALPVLQLYKNKAIVWQNTGYIEKESVVTQINSH